MNKKKTSSTIQYPETLFRITQDNLRYSWYCLEAESNEKIIKLSLTVPLDIFINSEEESLI